MLTASFSRVLGSGHAAQVSRVLTADPLSSCMVAARFEQVGMNEAAMGGQFWGIGGGRDGLLFAGASMVPLAGDASAMRTFAHTAARRGRKCATILGPADRVLPLWERLEPRWGPARERALRPAADGLPHRPARSDRTRTSVSSGRDELENYFPAAVAMFTEEVGVDPRGGDNGRSYHSRISELISAGRAYARFDGDTVMFKAEIGSLSRSVALIQGVWVHPRLRGRGLAAPAMASVVRSIQADLRRMPSLYVNDFNIPARRTYERIGFRQVGKFASVLF